MHAMPTGRRPPDTSDPEPEPGPDRPEDAVGGWRLRVGTLLEEVAAQRGLHFERTPADVTAALGGLVDTVEHLAAGMDPQQRRWLAAGLAALGGHVETTTLPDPPRPMVAVVVVTGPLGVLIGRRSDEAPPRVFPGGPLETGETPAEGAARVYEQDTGLPVTVEHEIGRHHHPATGSDTV